MYVYFLLSEGWLLSLTVFTGINRKFAMMQQVVFQLLGPPEIRYKEQQIKIPRRRTRALLYYLACTQAPQPRERLLELLCGDVDEESARHTFKTLLAEVRALLRSLDPAVEWIISDDDKLRLNPLAPLWLDTEIFEKGTAVTSRNLNRTISLYRGDFLDGFFLKDASGFEDWVRSTRDHFQHLYLSTLRRLADLYEADNQFEQAITYTRMLLATDPLMEDAYASLMRLYSMAGKRVQALREYERLCQVLAQELAVKPSATTRSLYEQIVRADRSLPVSRPVEAPMLLLPTHANSSASESKQLADGAPFVGRIAELAWLKQHLMGATNAATMILLAGVAGIGKTRLLQEALAESDTSRLLLQGICQEVEQVHSYHAVVEALRQGLTLAEVAQLNLPGIWRAQLAQLLPGLFPSDVAALAYAPIQPLVVVEALGAIFNQLARPSRPLFLLLDDLHWADEATLALLSHLARSARPGCVFLLGAYCTSFEQGRLAPLRRSVARLNKLAELPLPPLTAEDVAHLVAHFLAGEKLTSEPDVDHAALADWCYQRSAGNPFLVRAWLDQAQTFAWAPDSLQTLAVPEPVVALASAQLAFLSSEARSLLTAAAFVDGPFDPLTVASSIDIDKMTCLAACTELLKKNVITEAFAGKRGLYSFASSSVREVLLTFARPIERHFLP